MEIVRLAAGQGNATIGRLVITSASYGRVRASISITKPMSAVTQDGDYETVEQAERELIPWAERQGTSILYIEDASRHR